MPHRAHVPGRSAAGRAAHDPGRHPRRGGRGARRAARGAAGRLRGGPRGHGRPAGHGAAARSAAARVPAPGRGAGGRGGAGELEPSGPATVGRRPQRGRSRTRCWASAACASGSSRTGCTRCRCGPSSRRRATREDKGGHPIIEIMIPLVVTLSELELARRWVEEEIDETVGDRVDEFDVTIGTMIETPRAAVLRRRNRRGGRLLLVRHERPHPDDLRASVATTWRRSSRSTSRRACSKSIRSSRSTSSAWASSCGRASRGGRRTKPDLKIGRVRRARRRPGLDRVLLLARVRLRVVFAVPGPDRPVGRGPGRARARPVDAEPRSRDESGSSGARSQCLSPLLPCP